MSLTHKLSQHPLLLTQTPTQNTPSYPRVPSTPFSLPYTGTTGHRWNTASLCLLVCQSCSVLGWQTFSVVTRYRCLCCCDACMVRSQTPAWTVRASHLQSLIQCLRMAAPEHLLAHAKMFTSAFQEASERSQKQSFAPFPVSLTLNSVNDRHWGLKEERQAGIPEFLILASSICLLLSESGDFGHFSVQLWWHWSCVEAQISQRFVRVGVCFATPSCKDRAKDGASDTVLEGTQIQAI